MKRLLIALFFITFCTAKTKAGNDNSPERTAPLFHFAEGRNAKLISSFATLNHLLQSDSAANAVLAYTKTMRSLDVYFFKGKSNKNALVIGGVHGSELSAIEVANELVKTLQTSPKPDYNVIVIPCLFPDNAATAQQYSEEIGSTKNIGRYTNETTADPNRQMPPLGTFFNEASAIDMAGREIELENQILLQVIQVVKPERIASLHAIRNVNSSGVYADPRTDCKGIALGFEKDSLLAVEMAKQIKKWGGIAPGNKLETAPTALYYCDPEVARAGEWQKRNCHGSQLPGNLGFGVSLGSWASTSVCDDEENNRRDAATLLTVEFPGNKRPQDYRSSEEQKVCRRNVEAYANAIRSIFLQEDEWLAKK